MTKRPMMQEGRRRETFTRTREEKWALHVDGTRKPGVDTADMLARVQELLADPRKLRTVIIEVDS